LVQIFNGFTPAPAVERKPFVPSSQQQGFFNFMSEHKNGSALLIAVAGSGKSTSIVRSLPYVGEDNPVLILAFNAATTGDMKAKVDELRQEVGLGFRNVWVQTFHACGWGVLRKHLGNVKLESNKLRQLFRETYKKEQEVLYSAFVCKLVSFAKGEGIGVPGMTLDTYDAWRNIIDHQDMQLDSDDAEMDTAIDLARKFLVVSNEAAKKGLVDFDDQLYLPLLWNLRFYPQAIIFIDEAQDTNPVRRELVRRSLRSDGRVIAVGDPCQAIYGFTGATNDAMEIIKKEFNCIELPLTVSYRCPKAAVKQVQAIVPYFEVADTNVEGQVITTTLDVSLRVLTQKDVVLCRNTAPLVELCFKLISQGRPANVLGSEIGKGLVSLIKKMKASDIDELDEKITEYARREVTAAILKGQDSRAAAINDRVACIMVLVDGLDENQRTIDTLIRVIENMFADGRDTLTLSTAHKAKGREWLNVAIIKPELMPSPWAKKAWQVKQEMHLKYVAETRFQDTLMFIVPGEEKKCS
jgi:superfamily I DNA/RNA helicase